MFINLCPQAVTWWLGLGSYRGHSTPTCGAYLPANGTTEGWLLQPLSVPQESPPQGAPGWGWVG